jgi:hypothetical protein
MTLLLPEIDLPLNSSSLKSEDKNIRAPYYTDIDTKSPYLPSLHME